MSHAERGSFPHRRQPQGQSDRHQPAEQRGIAPARRVHVVAIVEDTEPGRVRTWSAIRGTVDLSSIDVADLYERESPQHARARAQGWIEDVPLIDAPRPA